MIKKFKIALLGFALMIFQSFTLITNNIIGVYGVSTSDSSVIQLQLDEDRTFTFQDYSNPNKKINISGTWEQKKGSVILSSPDYEGDFHSKWKFSKNFNMAKSRKGMTFYTLCKKE